MHSVPRAADAPVTDWFERAAVGASILCLIHCAGLPLLLTTLPALSTLVGLPEAFHLWVLAFAVPASGVALLLGTVRHRAWYPLLVGCVSLGLLATAGLVLRDAPCEALVTVAGSLMLVGAHLANWRLRHRWHDHG